MHKLITQAGPDFKKKVLSWKLDIFTLSTHFFDGCNVKILLTNMLYNAGVMSQSKKSPLPLQKENMDLILLSSLFSSNTALQKL